MDEADRLRDALVEELKASGHVRSRAVEAALREIPRHAFLPDLPLAQAYEDRYFVLEEREGQPITSASQPSMMAIMLEQLALEPGHRVLEIGAGTGYNAALMAHVVGPTGSVTTIDVEPHLVAAARARLAAVGLDRVRVLCADGGHGYPEGAPYDRIILTVGAWDVAPAWREQLARGGRLVLPLVLGGSESSIAFEPAGDHLLSVSVRPSSFIALRGEFAAPRTRIELRPGLGVWMRPGETLDAPAVLTLLERRTEVRSLGIRVTPVELYRGVVFWLATQERRFVWLRADQAALDLELVPHLFGITGRFCSTAGLFDDAGGCLLTRAPGDPVLGEWTDAAPAFELFRQCYGDSHPLADVLAARLAGWQRAGRPGLTGLRVRVFPAGSATLPHAAIIVEKRWSTFALDWPSA